jgi:rare lipoprotein A
MALRKTGAAVVALFIPLLLISSSTTLSAAEDAASSSLDSSTAIVEEGVIGQAVYYSKRYEGRRTTSGSIYRHERMTAAHATLPLGSRVRVVNLANGRDLVVKVTDRCRPRSFPFIDLSRGAAKKLGFLGKGAARVRIIPLTDQPE